MVSEPGSTGTDWRIHYTINLTDLQCDFFELTDVHGGETWRRVPIAAGDIVLGDRLYANPVGVNHVVRAGGDVVVRLNWHTLPLYEERGENLDPLRALRRLRLHGGEICDLTAWVRPAKGRPVAGRLIAVRRSAEATRAVRKKQQRRASKQQKRVSAKSREAARYFMLWTSLPPATPAVDILDFYRCRWQIELNFKRMKSLLGLGHLPKKDPASARVAPRQTAHQFARRTHHSGRQRIFPLGIPTRAPADRAGVKSICLPRTTGRHPANGRLIRLSEVLAGDRSSFGRTQKRPPAPAMLLKLTLMGGAPQC